MHLTDGAQLREQPTPTVHAQSAWIVPEETWREKKPAARVCCSDLLGGRFGYELIVPLEPLIKGIALSLA